MTEAVGAAPGGPYVAPPRKVSILLIVGIILFPIIFAWFLLRKGYSTRAKVIGFAWLAFTFLIFLGNLDSTPTTASPDATTPANKSEPATGGQASSNFTPIGKGAGPSGPATNWTYSADTDEMRGVTTKFAGITSDNELDFDFPYSGGSSGHLWIRQKGKGAVEIYLKMDKGQFLCDDYSHPSIHVKFDDGPIGTYSCNETSDGTADTIFIGSTSRFLTNLKGAKKLIIEAEFYQEGRRQLTFSPEGLAWPPKVEG